MTPEEHKNAAMAVMITDITKAVIKTTYIASIAYLTAYFSDPKMLWWMILALVMGD